MKSRLEYYDFLRGVAVIMVVAIHTFGVVYIDETLTLAGIFVRELLNCAVPLFCVSSAFFLINKNTGNYKMYLVPHILRVWIPLLVYSFPWFAYDVWKNGAGLTGVLKLIGGGYSVYYFAAVILQFYVLLPLFQKYKIFRNVPVMCLISLLWVAGYIYIVYPEYSQLPLLAYGGVILCWLVYFALGAAFMKDGIKSRVSVRLCLAGSIAALALSFAECIFLREKPGALPFDGIGLKPSAVLFAVCVCALLYSDRCAQLYRRDAVRRFIACLGRFSYGMYLAHMYAVVVGGVYRSCRVHNVRSPFPCKENQSGNFQSVFWCIENENRHSHVLVVR